VSKLIDLNILNVLVVVKLALLSNLLLSSAVFALISAFLMLFTGAVFFRVHRPDEQLALLVETAPHRGALRDLMPTPLLAAFLFWSTLLVFPGLASEVKGVVLPHGWVAIVMLSSYNTGDFVGRLAGLLWPRSVSWRVFAALAVARVVCCAPVVLLSSLHMVADLFAVPTLFIFGVSGGWLASSLGGDVSKQPAATTGSVLTMSILVGLFAGSLTSFAIEKLYRLV
jgi:hypothetical protein